MSKEFHTRGSKALTLAVMAFTANACGGPDEVPPTLPADTIFSGGPVITMQDAQPVAEAVAVRDGRIIAVGSAADLEALSGNNTRRVNLEGKPLLPGFVDSHGHVSMVGLQASTANLLPPPDGGVDSIDRLVETLGEWAAQYPDRVERFGWIIGFGYDDAQLADDRYPNRDDLDRVSSDIPVIIIHQSGHLGVASSLALERLGIDADTDDPPGGVFRRRPGSREPNGIAEEYAFFAMLAGATSGFDNVINDGFVVAGAELVATYGYTTAQDGRAMDAGVASLRRVAERGDLDIDVVAYLDILEASSIEPERAYRNRFRIGGAKLTIDGSPQGKTAFLTEPYYVAPEGRDADYLGYAAVSRDQVDASVESAYANNWQILVHANGDAAIDWWIDAVRKAQTAHPGVNVRPVLIHGQTLRYDQVAELDELGIFPSLFPMHTFYWGDWHRDSVLGPERAENISPTGWVRERGMRFGTHHDAPVALPDSMRVLSATVTRRTRSGEVLGPEQRVSVMTALKAMTIWPAWQHFEEADKGSIETGKFADFVVLSENPLTVDQNRLDDLKVVETIKEGVTIYRRQ